MNQMIRDLIDSAENNVHSAILVQFQQRFSSRAVRIATLALLDWLVDLPRGTKGQALEAPASYTWTPALHALIDQTPLSALFRVSDDKVDFGDGVSLQDREDLRTFVSTHYHPPMMDD